jgi:HAD superfamily hydrolase (TIGR01549 family)
LSLTLLVDLDNTLLNNDIDVFVPQYLRLFARHVSDQVDPDRFTQALLAGTQAMVRNHRPDKTLLEVFEAAFFPKVRLQPSQFQRLVDQFYEQVFPSLRGLAGPKPEAVSFVEACRERGYQMAIATNPLFPRTAIHQRLAWANLPVEKYPFKIISSYETFHFAKPEPAYFAELMARLGWPAEPVVVVGDDLERDVAAGRRIGLPAFWIASPGASSPDGPLGPTASGSLDQVLAWIDSAPVESLKPDFNQPEGLLAILYSTPAALDSLCRRLSEAAWSAIPQPGEWGLTEIACHLRDVEQEVNLTRVRRMLGESNPFLAGEDTDPWAEQRGYHYQDGPEALKQFTTARLALISLLESMPPDCWQAPARHAIFGPTTLLEMVSIQAAHDRAHIQQVHQLLQAIQPPS